MTWWVPWAAFGLAFGVGATMAYLTVRHVLHRAERRDREIRCLTWGVPPCPGCGKWPKMVDLDGRLDTKAVYRCDSCDAEDVYREVPWPWM